jgi:HNH endonuclease
MPRTGQSISSLAKRLEFLKHLIWTGPGDECILWPWVSEGAESKYGRLWDAGKRVPAHRWVFIQINGPIPDELNVCHTCDNPPCCRPSHLFSGTDKDNLADAARKGHMKGGTAHLRGEQHGMAKLSDEKVTMIRSLVANGITQRAVAKATGMSKIQISRIVRRQNWSHLP